MMYARKIRMKPSCYYSNDLTEIDEIYVDGCNNPGYFKKAVLYDHLVSNPGTIRVAIAPYPNVLPAKSFRGEKYVRSESNGTTRDNLLSLPRER